MFFQPMAMRRLFRLMCAACLAVSIDESVWGEPAGAPEMARAALEAVEQKYASLKTLRYDAVRRVTSDRQSSEDRWTFFYSAPDKVRVDAQTPHERTVIVNGEVMTEYIPLLRKAVVTRLASRPAAEREKIISSVLARVAIEGIRPGRYAEMAEGAGRFVRDGAGPGMTLIEGESPPYRVVVDTERLVLLSIEVRDPEGQVKLRADASDFIEASPGFWMPSRLEWAQAGSGGVARCEARLGNVRANDDLPDSLFVPNLPEGTRIDNR